MIIKLKHRLTNIFSLPIIILDQFYRFLLIFIFKSISHRTAAEVLNIFTGHYKVVNFKVVIDG